MSSACGSGSADEKVGESPDSGSSSNAVGTPADDSKSPVTVGFHNLEGGSISLPNIRLGFEAGIEYVNTELGGINGHPLAAEFCKTDGTPEASVNCANQFVQEQVVLAVQGADFGADAMLPVMQSAGLAGFANFPLTPGMNTAVGDAYFMNSSAEEGYAADVVQQQELGATKLALAMVDNAASRETYDGIIEPAGEKLGVETKVFYYPTQADWTVLSATMLAWGPDAVTLWAAGGDVLAAVQSLRAAGFSGYIDAASNVEIIPELDTSVLEKVIFSSPFYQPSWSDLPDTVKPDMEAFERYTGDIPDAAAAEAQLQQGFNVAVLAAEALRQVGDADEEPTAKTVHDGMGSVKGDRQFFRTIGWDCSEPTWPGTTACGTGMIFASVGGDGTLVPLPDQPVDVTAVLPQ